MNVQVKVFLALFTMSLFAHPPANAGVSIEKACAQVFEDGREKSEVVDIDGHGFVVKKRKSTVERDGNTITVSGYIWHDIAGENDRIYYTIVVRKGQPYEATIEEIDLGGLFKNKKSRVVDVGLSWSAQAGGGLAGAILTKHPVGAEIGREVGEEVGKVVGKTVGKYLEKAVLKVANKVQRKLIGNWTPAMGVMLDGMASYFDNQINSK
jgi:hypothetical protein